MRRFFGLSTIFVSALMLASSCTKEPAAEPQSAHQQRSLDAWIATHRPDLIDNRQEEGYYVELFEEGTPIEGEVKPLGESETTWITFDLDVRTLSGKLCLTRSAARAKQENTFTKYTHYVPVYRYCGSTNYSLLEGTYYALRNELSLGGESYRARIGTKMRLYLPASIAYKNTGASDDGGYGGQYSLDGNKPVMVDIFIRDTVNNPLQREGVDVDFFAENNGGLRPLPETEEEDDNAATQADEEQNDDDLYAWRNAVDTIPQLYINRRYVPNADTPSFNYRTEFVKPYQGYEPYDNLTELDKKINAALIKRFGNPAELVKGDTIGETNRATVWYIGRFLDGFIFDTNIDEVKELIYGEVASSVKSINYTPEDDKSSYIISWYHLIRQMRYGEWSALLTTSTFAYGATGMTGGSSTTSSSASSYYDYLNYYNYMNYYNNYYGGYYGGYYGNYYNNYYGGYYNPYYYGDMSTDTSTTTTTTTYSTEILPYTPLLFQIFVEEKK